MYGYAGLAVWSWCCRCAGMTEALSSLTYEPFFSILLLSFCVGYYYYYNNQTGACVRAVCSDLCSGPLRSAHELRRLKAARDVYRHAYRHAYRHVYRHMDRHADRHVYRHVCRHMCTGMRLDMWIGNLASRRHQQRVQTQAHGQGRLQTWTTG